MNPLDLTRFSCLSFDCYGTLIDWEAGIEAALRPVLARHEISVERDALLARFAGAETALEAGPYRPYREILRDVLDEMGTAFGFQPSPAERDAFAGSVADWPAFADSGEALRALGARYRLIVLSNIDDDLFAYSRAKLGATFDAVFTAQRIGSYKPSPANFAYLVEHAGCPRGTILHVAQSLFHDIGPARDAGLATVWVNRRAGSSGFGATPPASARPDLEVPSLGALAALASVPS